MYITSLVFKSARNRIAKYCHHPLSCSKFTTAFRSSKWEILLWSSASCAVTAYHEHFCQPIRKIVGEDKPPPSYKFWGTRMPLTIVLPRHKFPLIRLGFSTLVGSNMTDVTQSGCLTVPTHLNFRRGSSAKRDV